MFWYIFIFGCAKKKTPFVRQEIFDAVVTIPIGEIQVTFRGKTLMVPSNYSLLGPVLELLQNKLVAYGACEDKNEPIRRNDQIREKTDTRITFWILA
jgi:hypothetical protein